MTVPTHVTWTASDINTTATVVVALAAVLALVATTYQASASRKAVQATRRSAVDANAPRLIIDALPPLWPPREQSGFEAGHYSPVRPGLRYDDPADFGRRLAVEARLRLANEGRSTALVTLPPGVIPLAGADANPEPFSKEWLHWIHQQSQDVMIRPGDSLWVLALRNRPISEWAALADHYAEDLSKALEDVDAHDPPGVRFTITAADQYALGVRDTTVVDLVCLPVRRSTQSNSSVEVLPVIGNQPELPVAVSRVRRTLRDYLD